MCVCVRVFFMENWFNATVIHFANTEEHNRTTKNRI